MEKFKRSNRGITLIALIITVIVMLILAGVAINMTIGDNGIFKKTADSADITKRENAREKLSLVLTDVQMRRIKEGESLALSEEMATEIAGYKDITNAKFTGSKIETVVDGYNFEVNGDLGIDTKKEIAKVEPENLDDWEYRIESDGTATLLTYKGSATKVVVPNYIEGYWVKQVGEEVMDYGKGHIWSTDICEKISNNCYQQRWEYAQKTITEIEIAEGIEIIGPAAFVCTNNLEKITIPKSVTKIGEYAIALECALRNDSSTKENKLQELKIYKEVQNIGAGIFNGREAIIINVECEENEIPSGWNAEWNRNRFQWTYNQTVELTTTINYGVKM